MPYRRAGGNFRFNPKKINSFYFLCLSLLFWAVFDGMISFITPVLITSRGISETKLGFIIGFSALAGIFFDFFLCRFLKEAKFRRIYLVMFMLCLFYPLILWQAKTVIFFLLIMAWWGLYFDLSNIANFDYVGEEVEEERRSSVLGTMRVFYSVGYLLAPLIAGAYISQNLTFGSFSTVWFFLAGSACFFLLLLIFRKEKNQQEIKFRKTGISLLRTIVLWKKIGRFIFPVLILTFFLSLTDAFFWTIGPLFSGNLLGGGKLSGLLLVAYQAPILITGWFISRVNDKYGKKGTAILSLIIGGLLLAILGAVEGLWLLLVVFIASFFISFSWPSIASAYGDYLSETPQAQAEIETLQDSFSNLGYIFGPIVAGLLGGLVGNKIAFSILGILITLAMIILLKITPKNINIKLNKSDLPV